MVREMAGLDEGGPLFAQVAERLAGEIADGGLAEGARVPSSNSAGRLLPDQPGDRGQGDQRAGR